MTKSIDIAARHGSTDHSEHAGYQLDIKGYGFFTSGIFRSIGRNLEIESIRQ